MNKQIYEYVIKHEISWKNNYCKSVKKNKHNIIELIDKSIFMHSFIYVLIHLFIYSSIYVSIHRFIDSSIYPFIHISIYLLIHCLSTDSILIHYLSIDSFIYLFIDLYILLMFQIDELIRQHL